jgi:TatD DNase family protein
MLIDTHCHLDYDPYDADRAAVLARAQAAGVSRVIIPATDLDSGRRALALAEQYDGIYYAAGIHPNQTATYSPSDLAAVEALAAHSKNVAIGEIGLDYHWDFSPKSQQYAALEGQLALAARLEKPVILHNRESSDDLLAILRAWVSTLPASLRARPGVLHSFSAPRAVAEQALELGFYLGFTGPITYKNANDLRLIAGAVPTDRILIETDGPYLTPVPHRGSRNEPAYVRLVAERLATLHRLPQADFFARTTRNAEILFALP